jgi:hypothetical protein
MSANKIALKRFNAFLITYCMTIFVLLGSSAFAAPICETFYANLNLPENISWKYLEHQIQWKEKAPDGSSFYAIAGISPAGFLYFNLKLVSEDGKTRSNEMSGRDFVPFAINYFNRTGRTVNGIKGWWAFRSDDSSPIPFDEQIAAAPNTSINFFKYWTHRRHENDVEAAKGTWTAKMVAQLGYTEVHRVVEYDKLANYYSIHVTFLPKNMTTSEIKKTLLGGKESLEIPLGKAFNQTGMGEDPTATWLNSLFRLNVDQAMLIKIIEDNSQIAGEYKALGFEIIGAERRKEKGEFQIYIKIR